MLIAKERKGKTKDPVRTPRVPKSRGWDASRMGRGVGWGSSRSGGSHGPAVRASSDSMGNSPRRQSPRPRRQPSSAVSTTSARLRRR